MSKKVKVKASVWSIGRGYNRIVDYDSPTGEYRKGTVFTKQGIVYVYAQNDERPSFKYSSVEFVYNGDCYVRSWDTYYSTQYLVTLAKRLVKDVIEIHGVI